MDPNKVIHELDTKNAGQISYGRFFTYIAVAVIVGAVLGFGISSLNKKNTKNNEKKSGEVAQTAGVIDKKTFKDSAEGILREGGIDGEGNFHLERPGGISQNAYLTSSTVDLSNYVGKKVKVWGQTFSGQTAGWLMDVGLVEVQ